MIEDIRSACAAFDGRDTLPLEALALEHQGDAGYLGAVWDVAEEADGQALVAASWLLLRVYRKDAAAACGAADRLAGLLMRADHHHARLHIIQSLDRAAAAGGMRAPQREQLAAALRADAAHDRPFIRAWTLSVLARLSADTPSVRPWVRELVERAEHEGPASLRARLRQVSTAGALDWLIE